LRVQDKFAELKKKDGRALIAYVMAGDPSIEQTPAIIKSLVAGGADIIELGIPFSDPIADGPTIQAAGERALSSGTNIKKIFSAVKEVRSFTDVPLVFMSYYNPPLQYGLERFFSDMRSNGVEGVIIPDLPIEESDEAFGLAKKYGRDLIFIAAPTTTEARLKKICARAGGFLYLVSLLGVTGARASLDSRLPALINMAKKCSRIPVAVGFGVSKPEHVLQVVQAGADGVIVGSAIVKLIAEKKFPEIEPFVRSLKDATTNG